MQARAGRYWTAGEGGAVRLYRDRKGRFFRRKSQAMFRKYVFPLANNDEKVDGSETGRHREFREKVVKTPIKDQKTQDWRHSTSVIPITSRYPSTVYYTIIIGRQRSDLQGFLNYTAEQRQQAKPAGR